MHEVWNFGSGRGGAAAKFRGTGHWLESNTPVHLQKGTRHYSYYYYAFSKNQSSNSLPDLTLAQEPFLDLATFVIPGFHTCTASCRFLTLTVMTPSNSTTVSTLRLRWTRLAGTGECFPDGTPYPYTRQEHDNTIKTVLTKGKLICFLPICASRELHGIEGWHRGVWRCWKIDYVGTWQLIAQGGCLNPDLQRF